MRKNGINARCCCVLRTHKLRSKLVGSIFCGAKYPEGARTARIGEANQASEYNGVLTTLAWVALPKGKEPNAVSAETFANANASTNAKNTFYGRAALNFCDI